MWTKGYDEPAVPNVNKKLWVRLQDPAVNMQETLCWDAGQAQIEKVEMNEVVSGVKICTIRMVVRREARPGHSRYAGFQYLHASLTSRRERADLTHGG